MIPDRAVELARRVTNATGGWTEPAALELVKEITAWQDTAAAVMAVEQVVRGWDRSGRPPLGYIVRTYNECREAIRREQAFRQEAVVEPEGPPISLAEGHALFMAAYEAECRSQGREPNPAYAENWLKRLGQSTAPQP